MCCVKVFLKKIKNFCKRAQVFATGLCIYGESSSKGWPEGPHGGTGANRRSVGRYRKKL